MSSKKFSLEEIMKIGTEELLKSGDFVEMEIKWALGFKKFFQQEWLPNFPCPKCGKHRLDLSKPYLHHPIICRDCHTLFDLKPAKAQVMK